MPRNASAPSPTSSPCSRLPDCQKKRRDDERLTTATFRSMPAAASSLDPVSLTVGLGLGMVIMAAIRRLSAAEKAGCCNPGIMKDQPKVATMCKVKDVEDLLKEKAAVAYCRLSRESCLSKRPSIVQESRSKVLMDAIDARPPSLDAAGAGGARHFHFVMGHTPSSMRRVAIIPGRLSSRSRIGRVWCLQCVAPIRTSPATCPVLWRDKSKMLKNQQDAIGATAARASFLAARSSARQRGICALATKAQSLMASISTG